MAAKFYTPSSNFYFSEDVFGVEKDITGVPALTALTLPNSLVKLRVDVSQLGGLDPDKVYEASNNNIIWTMGDGGTQRGHKITHNYKWPGIYRPTLGVVNRDGTVIHLGGVKAPVITVRNWMQEKIGWYYPTSAYPAGEDGNFLRTEAGRTSSTLWLLKSNSWQSYAALSATGYTIELYAGGSRLNEKGEMTERGRSKSIPLVTAQYDINKYIQFQKTWRFTTDPEGQNPVSSVIPTDTKIYVKLDADPTSPLSGTFYECDEQDEGSTFAGTSGYSTVYYTDDTANLDSAVGLVASFNTSRWPNYINVRYTGESWLGAVDQSKFTDLKLNQFEAPPTRIGMRVTSNKPAKLVFTSNGISSPVFYISKNKFQHTEIPFFVSVADVSKNIIKDFPGFGLSTALTGVSAEEFFPGTEPSTYEANTVYFGLCADATVLASLAGNVTYTDNTFLTAVDTIGSYSGSFNSSITADNVTLVGKMSTHSGIISGASDPFSILPDTGKYNVLKINEHYDFSNNIQSYILQENINQNDKLVNGFFHEIFGDRYSIPETLGKIVYEKIANFVKNNVDVDTCNVNNLYGLAKQVDFELEGYNLSFPGGIKRIVDLLSIGHKKLFGARNTSDIDFDKRGTPDRVGELARYGRNRKDTGGDDELSTDTYIVTAGEPIIGKEVFQSRYFKITPLIVPLSAGYSGIYTSSAGVTGLSSYPLSAYNKGWGWGLEWNSDGKFSDYYRFYEYIPNSVYPLSSFDQLEGVIDWHNTQELLGNNYSVLQESLTSYSDWIKQDGIIDTVIEHKLRKGLGTFTNTG